MNSEDKVRMAFKAFQSTSTKDNIVTALKIMIMDNKGSEEITCEAQVLLTNEYKTQP